MDHPAHFRSNASVGSPTPVTGGEGRIDLTVYGPQSYYRKSHHLLGDLRFHHYTYTRQNESCDITSVEW